MAKKYKEIISDNKKQAKKLMNDEQLKKCNLAIHTASVSSAAAGAIPIPVADAIPITAIQITMVMSLGNIFEMKVTESVAKALIGSIASTIIGRNLVKIFPVVGWVVSSAVAAGVTEAIGWSIAVDFARKAKENYESDFISEEAPESSTQQPQNDESANPSEDYLLKLEERANAFFSGELKGTSSEEERLSLISDIEKILDTLPDDHKLREIYTKLSECF